MFVRLKGSEHVQEAVGQFAEQLLATGEWEDVTPARALNPEEIKKPYEVAASAGAPERAVTPRPLFRRGGQ